MESKIIGTPSFVEKERKIILKGKIYECQGTIVMAMETTCSLTKDTFKAICIGYNLDWQKSKIVIVGSEMNCYTKNYEEYENKNN